MRHLTPQVPVIVPGDIFKLYFQVTELLFDVVVNKILDDDIAIWTDNRLNVSQTICDNLADPDTAMTTLDNLRVQVWDPWFIELWTQLEQKVKSTNEPT